MSLPSKHTPKSLGETLASVYLSANGLFCLSTKTSRSNHTSSTHPNASLPLFWKLISCRKKRMFHLYCLLSLFVNFFIKFIYQVHLPILNLARLKRLTTVTRWRKNSFSSFRSKHLPLDNNSLLILTIKSYFSCLSKISKVIFPLNFPLY